jgi:hypothetical protein
MKHTYEFDHLFIFTSVGAPAVDQLVEFGLIEGARNTHPGQGTACRRVFFHNGMLEFLWVQNTQEVQSDIIAPTRLWERFQYQQTGYSPFGICFRPVSSAGPANRVELPFETWAYRPPYLPDTLQIDVAQNWVYPQEPMLFCIPFGGRPDGYPAERQQPISHPIGFREITELRIELPVTGSKSTAVKAIERDEFVSFVNGGEHLAEVTFDQAKAGQSVDFRPALPLVFHW